MAPPVGTLRVGRYFLALALILAVLYAIVFWPGQRHTPKLGIDLVGGTEVTFTAKTPNGSTPSRSSMQQAKDIMTNRVNGTGVSQSTVAIQGGNQLIVDIPKSANTNVADLGKAAVLSGVDLDVVRGEVVLLRGANGAGKTSLLRACAGLLRVVAGEAVVLGHDMVADQRAVRRRVGLLGHQTSLYDEMTAADNVHFALRASRRPLAASGPAMEMLGVTGRLASTRVGALSAGQRRRVALSILVARDPELWLLDEPHAGLDAEHRDLLDGLVRGAASRGTTVLLASHEADRAAALAQRVVTVAGGVVTAGGPAAAGGPTDRAVISSVA